MQKYNQCDRKNECGNCLNGPLIYNTYQLYLKDGYARMFADLQHAHRSHFIKRDELIHSKPEVEQAVIPYQFAVKIGIFYFVM